MPAQTQIRERARIREALIDLCFEHGFRELSIEQLLDRARVSRSSFEREYCDLEQCFYEVYRGELERFQELTEAARAGLGDWRDRVRATAYALFAFLAEDERVTHLVAVEVRGAGERVQLLFGQEIEALFDLIDEGRQEPGAPASLTRATAETVGGGIFNQIYTAAAAAGGPGSNPNLILEMMYTVVLPYLGPEAAFRELSIPPPPG